MKLSTQTTISFIVLIPVFACTFVTWIVFASCVILSLPICLLPVMRKQTHVGLPKANGEPNIQVSYIKASKMIRMTLRNIPGFGSSLLDLFF